MRLPSRGCTSSRRQLAERLEHEGALVQPGMRDAQPGFVEHQRAVEQQIEVERARAPARTARRAPGSDSISSSRSSSARGATARAQAARRHSDRDPAAEGRRAPSRTPSRAPRRASPGCARNARDRRSQLRRAIAEIRAERHVGVDPPVLRRLRAWRAGHGQMLLLPAEAVVPTTQLRFRSRLSRCFGRQSTRIHSGANRAATGCCRRSLAKIGAMRTRTRSSGMCRTSVSTRRRSRRRASPPLRAAEEKAEADERLEGDRGRAGGGSRRARVLRRANQRASKGAELKQQDREPARPSIAHRAALKLPDQGVDDACDESLGQGQSGVGRGRERPAPRDQGRISADQLSARLDGGALELIDQKIDIGRWYPMKQFTDLLDIDWEVGAKRDPAYMRRQGERRRPPLQLGRLPAAQLCRARRSRGHREGPEAPVEADHVDQRIALQLPQLRRADRGGARRTARDRLLERSALLRSAPPLDGGLHEPDQPAPGLLPSLD